MLKDNNINSKWLALSLAVSALTVVLLLVIQPPTLVLQTTVVSLISFISISWALMGPNDNNAAIDSKSDNSELSAVDRFESRNNLRSVGLKLQGMGQLSLAFEKYKQCTENHDTANLLYNLATDFQIKGEPDNAKEVLQYIATFEPNFKDLKDRIAGFSGDILTDVEPNELSSHTTENLTSDAIDARQDNLIDDTATRKVTLQGEAVNEFSIPSITPDATTFEKAVASDKTILLPADEVPNDEAILGDEASEYPALYGSRYRVKSILGQGTTGAVFQGTDIVTDETIAIKVLNLSDELEDNQLDEYKFRFHREIETAGKLDHPNIVKILDSGETDGFAYIAMEYVDGTNLRNFARADSLLEPKTVLKIIAQCADALGYSHKQGLIHRDIKPANIIYNSRDDYVKLTDFGIARVPDSTRTRAGSILGTPLYMSPEQLAGETLDARSDLYSLGVTLYHLLTGFPPFRPKTMAELMRSIAQEQHKDLSEINPGTPSCIAWAVNKSLEKSPDKRFQSAASMANKLRECEMMIDE